MSETDHLHQQSGTEFARTKEDQAAIMRAKQAAGAYLHLFPYFLLLGPQKQRFNSERASIALLTLP